MKISYLDAAYCQQCYDAHKQRVEEFESQRQSSWYFQAKSLVSLAKTAYAIGQPISECKSWLKEATNAYSELFALRGTTNSKRTSFKDGEESVADDGFTSADSFAAAVAALAISDFELATELVGLAGHSPNAHLVSPRSEVCTTNEQTLSHALNALLNLDKEVAHHEASQFESRRATKSEKQIALVISAIANDGDMLIERDTLLRDHEQNARKRNNQLNTDNWLCLPALGLSFLAMHVGQIEIKDLDTDNLYCPMDFLS